MANVRLTAADIEERVPARVLALYNEIRAGQASRPPEKEQQGQPLTIAGGTTGRTLAQLIEEGTI